MEGTQEFLQALGFISVVLPVEGQGKLIPLISPRYLEESSDSLGSMQ